MNQLAINFESARELGEQAANACLAKARKADPEFAEKAAAAILAFMDKHLSYDAETGILKWKVDYYRVSAGAIAGSITPYGYRRMKLLGENFMVHRLVWLYVYGVWPSQEIDHIDRNKLNNKITNLRDVSKSVNQQNQKNAPVSNKSTGLLGVSIHKRRRENPYSAYITTNKHRISLGYFPSAESAQDAYLAAKREMHEGCPIEWSHPSA